MARNYYNKRRKDGEIHLERPRMHPACGASSGKRALNLSENPVGVTCERCQQHPAIMVPYILTSIERIQKTLVTLDDEMTRHDPQKQDSWGETLEHRMLTARGTLADYEHQLAKLRRRAKRNPAIYAALVKAGKL